MNQQSERFDAIVVGSGISGGWAAKELTERGLRVLMLERGKNVEHRKDYPNARKAPWEYPHRGGRTREMVELLSGPAARLSAEREKSRLVGIGERLALHRGQALRLVSRLSGRWTIADVGTTELSPERFRFRGEREGRHRDRLAGSLRGPRAVVQTASNATRAFPDAIEHLPQLPDGQFQPAMPLNCAEEMVSTRLAKLFEGNRRLIPGRCANLTRAIGSRIPCQSETRAGLDVRPARTSARRRQRCRRRRRPDG